MNLLVGILLGHLVGDYLLQNKWMAVNKSASNFKCFVHVTLYTLSVLLFTNAWDWRWAVVIFVPHYLIDRYSLADKWLDLIHGRSLRDFIINGKKNIPAELDRENYHALRGGFTVLVYAVADNTMHLLCLWYGAKWLGLAMV